MKANPLLLSVVALAFVAALVGCGVGAKRPAPQANGLLARLHGQRNSAGALVIDERRGTFAGVRMGMPLTKARRAMPSAYYLPRPFQENWCGRFQGPHTCTGLLIRLDGVCKVTNCTEVSPPLFLNEIQLSALADPSGISESRRAATLKGITLGANAHDVETRYGPTGPSVGDCSETAPADARALVVVAGGNTLLFSVFHGKVWVITLIAGKHPHACSGGHAY